jgi:thiopeptide-type bacteriocin biosynthesis protein
MQALVPCQAYFHRKKDHMVEQKQSIKQQQGPLYVSADVSLVRAPALPAQVFLQLSEAGQVDGEMELDEALQAGTRACTALLLELVTQPQIAQALAVASPSLMEGVERLQRGELKPTRQLRVWTNLLRYLARMSTRPTPFGLFAGVGIGTFSESTDLCLGERALAGFRARPDMGWLLAFLQHIESLPDLVSQLQIQLNQTAYLVGERAILPLSNTYGSQSANAISLRATSVVRKVFALTRQFLPYTELQIAIQQAFPRATEEQVKRVLWQLWEHGFLISQQHPPLTDARPDIYIFRHLEALQGIDEIKAQFSQVLDALAALNCAGIGAPISRISTVAQKQKHLLPESSKETLPLQVDGLLHLQTPTLNRSLGEVAATAARFLLRQTGWPRGFSSLQEYRLLFLDTFGEQAEVPLLDLLSPEHGIGAPTGYDQPPLTYHRPSHLPPPDARLRDQVLLRLVTEAINQRRLEVELTEELQQQLERWPPRLEEAPLSLEVYLQVHAASNEAIDRGEWTAIVGRNPGSLNAGRSFGRFFDLLSPQDQEQVARIAVREEALRSEVIFAELSYQPSQARMANVAIRPPVRSYEIAVGTTPSVSSEHVLTLSDLVVGVQNGRFYLRSLRLGKRVQVSQGHMLNSAQAPNVCRFLADVAQDGIPCLSIFDWGALTSAPFLPRLVMKVGPAATLVISPACWQLQAGTITPRGEGSEEARWFRGLQHWRNVWQVPRYVYLAYADNRLLLDLEHALMALDLRDELKKLQGQGQLMLDEVLPNFEHLWLRDAEHRSFFSELVIPLLRADVFERTETSTPQEQPLPRSKILQPVERRQFPGEEWVYLKLYAALNQHEELLAGPMREVVRTLQERELIDQWFFIRYVDPEPHLRLRFHAHNSEALHPILSLVLPWSAQLARYGQIQRFSLETYDREVERYGGPQAIDLLEQVFHVNSVLVSELIVSQRTHHLRLDPLLIAVYTLDAFFTAWGWDRQQCQAWTHQASKHNDFHKAYRSERKTYCTLFLSQEPTDTHLAQQRRLLLDLVSPHQHALHRLGTQVRQLAAAGALWVTETSLLNSLAHMHVNRLLGIDRHKESQVYSFWRQTLDVLLHISS